MRTLIFSMVAVVLATSSPVMASGTFGSIDLGYLGRPGPHMGNGGRFDYDIVSDSGLSLPAGFDLNRYDSPSSVVPGGQDGVDDLFTFCIETSQSVPGNASSNSYMVDPVGAGSAFDLLGDYYFALAVQPGNNTEAGAFQLAAWELMLGDGDLGTPPATASGSYTAAAIALATTWLNNVTGGSLTDIVETQMVTLKNGSFQDQVTQITAVPEASALIVWSFVGGVIGLVVYRRHVLAPTAESPSLG
jgi:hypothetical protein